MKKLKSLLICLLVWQFSNSQVCTQTGDYTIPVGGATSSSLAITGFSNDVVIVNGDFTIDNSFTINDGTVLFIANGVRIRISNTGDLKLYDSRLFSCGNSMWQGIHVESNGFLEMEGNQLEDAEVGVSTLNYTSNVIITQNRFNKNFRHLSITDANCNNIIITGNTFSCEDLMNPNSFFGNTLELPHLGQKTEMSIVASSNDNILNIGTSANISTGNSFSNCKFGIRLDDTDAHIYNNTFTDIRGFIAYPFNPISPYYPEYTAIGGFSFLTGSEIIIGGTAPFETNVFTDCNIGIDLNDYKNVTVIGNDFINTQLPPASFVVSESGTNGVSINLPSKFNNTSITIKQNTFYRIKSSIGYYFGNQTTISNDVLDISNNIIEGETNIIGHRGINIIGNMSVVKRDGVNNFTVLDNDMEQLQLGIVLMSLSGIEPLLEKNKIEINWRSLQTGHGIDIRGCTGSFLYNNRIWGPGISITEQPFIGIRTDLSNDIPIMCNKIFNIGQSLYFRGLTPSIVVGNRLQNAYDGWVMGPNAVIGPQGDVNSATDNKWVGTFTNSRTFTINTNCNVDSPIFMRGGNTFLPPAATNKTDSGNPITEAYSLGAGGLNQVQNPGAVLNCPLLFNFPLLQIMQDIVREKVAFTDFLSQSRWISKKLVFDEIIKDSSLLNDPIIDSFALAGTISYSDLNLISNEIGMNNFSQAIILSNSFTAANLPEENYQNFYKIYSTYFNTHQLPQSDYDKLVEIAEQCPLKGGNAVFEARALREYIDKQFYVYEENCEEIIPKSFFEVTDEMKNNFSIYPNPSSGIFMVQNASDIGGVFKLYDLIGHEIYTATIGADVKESINLENLNSGMYLYEFLFDNSMKATGKLSIFK